MGRIRIQDRKLQEGQDRGPSDGTEQQCPKGAKYPGGLKDNTLPPGIGMNQKWA